MRRAPREHLWQLGKRWSDCPPWSRQRPEPRPGREERQQGTCSGKRAVNALEEPDSSLASQATRSRGTAAGRPPLSTSLRPSHHPAGGPGAAPGTVPGSPPSPNSSTASQVLQMELAILMERIRGYTVSRGGPNSLGTVDVTFWDPLGKGANRSRPSNWPCFLCSRPDAIPAGAGGPWSRARL